MTSVNSIRSNALLDPPAKQVVKAVQQVLSQLPRDNRASSPQKTAEEAAKSQTANKIAYNQPNLAEADAVRARVASAAASTGRHDPAADRDSDSSENDGSTENGTRLDVTV